MVDKNINFLHEYDNASSKKIKEVPKSDENCKNSSNFPEFKSIDNSKRSTMNDLNSKNSKNFPRTNKNNMLIESNKNEINNTENKPRQLNTIKDYLNNSSKIDEATFDKLVANGDCFVKEKKIRRSQ